MGTQPNKGFSPGFRLLCFLLGLLLIFLGIILIVAKHSSFAHVVGTWALVVGSIDLLACQPWK